MEEGTKEEKNAFEELGLKVGFGQVEVGKTYPIFGAITRLVDETPGRVVVEINNNIIARMNIPDEKRLNVLKERAFESGIFVSKIVSKDSQVVVDCQTVIFGKKQSFNA